MGKFGTILVPLVPHQLVVVKDNRASVFEDYFVPVSVVRLVTVTFEYFAVFVGHVVCIVYVSRAINARTKRLDTIYESSPFDTLFDVICHLVNLF